MTNLLSIGAFSRICRLSVRTLRRYHEQGLLVPSWVDPQSGYRYYRSAQVDEATRIRLLRELDVPLADVRRILQADDPSRVHEVLAAHEHRLEVRIEEQVQALASLRQLMSTSEALVDRYVVRSMFRDPIRAATARRRTSLARVNEVLGEALGEVFATLGRHGEPPSGPPFAVYHGDTFDPDDVDMEIGVPVGASSEVPLTEFEGGDALVTVHCGGYDQVHRAYSALGAWAEAHGERLGGPAREHYLVGPAPGRDPADYRTEVVWPLAPPSRRMSSASDRKVDGPGSLRLE